MVVQLLPHNYHIYMLTLCLNAIVDAIFMTTGDVFSVSGEQTNGSCHDSNGGCTDICLSTPHGPRCACWIAADFVFGSKCSVTSEFHFTLSCKLSTVTVCVWYCILCNQQHNTDIEI